MSLPDMKRNEFYLQPKFLCGLLSFVNFLNFMDRGIIPGATNEFNTFIQNDLNTDTPSMYLGLLQSSFIVGFIIGSLIFGHMIHHYGRFYLVAIGISIWTIAVVSSGCSFLTGSYTFLIFARMLSGVGEASLQCTVPPWIEVNAPAGSKGTWLSVFFCAIPVGTAAGFALSSVLAESVGWEYAFFLEAVIMAPCAIFMFSICHNFPCEHDTRARVHRGSSGSADSKHVLSVTRDPDATSNSRSSSVDLTNENRPPTFIEEFLIVTSSPVYLCLTFGYAAQTGTLIGLSTFGSAFMMGLGYFDTESEASTIFGLLVSVAGLVGTILGGIMLDRMLVKNDTNENVGQALESTVANHDFVRRNSDDIMSTLLDPDHHPSHKGDKTHSHELNNITKLITASSLIGFLCLVLNYFVYNKGFYLFMVTVGCLFIFLCGSGTNMGIMLAVPHKHRSFGIAIMAVCIHAFGDVPSPVIAGIVKDYLAPGCVPNEESDDGNIAASDACRDDNAGLRLCMLLINLWLAWTVLFFFLAYCANRGKFTFCGGCIRCFSWLGLAPDPSYTQVGDDDQQQTERDRVSHGTRGSTSSNLGNRNSVSRNSTGGGGYDAPRTGSTSSSTANPLVGENFNSYVASKKQELGPSGRTRSGDSQRSKSSDSATIRTVRLSGSLTKSSSTEDLLNSFSLGSGQQTGGRASGSHRSKSSDLIFPTIVDDTVMV